MQQPSNVDKLLISPHFPPFPLISPHFPSFPLIFPHFPSFPPFIPFFRGLLDTGILRIWILPRLELRNTWKKSAPAIQTSIPQTMPSFDAVTMYRCMIQFYFHSFGQILHTITVFGTIDILCRIVVTMRLRPGRILVSEAIALIIQLAFRRGENKIAIFEFICMQFSHPLCAFIACNGIVFHCSFWLCWKCSKVCIQINIPKTLKALHLKPKSFSKSHTLKSRIPTQSSAPEHTRAPQRTGITLARYALDSHTVVCSMNGDCAKE